MDLDLLTIKSALELYFSISVANGVLLFAILLLGLFEGIEEVCKFLKEKKVKKE